MIHLKNIRLIKIIEKTNYLKYLAMITVQYFVLVSAYKYDVTSTTLQTLFVGTRLQNPCCQTLLTRCYLEVDQSRYSSVITILNSEGEKSQPLHCERSLYGAMAGICINKRFH